MILVHADKPDKWSTWLFDLPLQWKLLGNHLFASPAVDPVVVSVVLQQKHPPTHDIGTTSLFDLHIFASDLQPAQQTVPRFVTSSLVPTMPLMKVVAVAAVSAVVLVTATMASAATAGAVSQAIP